MTDPHFLDSARPILGKEDSVRERPISDGMIQTTRGPMTEKQAKTESPLQLWIKRYKEAHAERLKAEERAEKAEENLARQKQINALALDFLEDAELLKLTDLIKAMDKEVKEPSPLDDKHAAMVGGRTQLSLNPVQKVLDEKAEGGHYHDDGSYHAESH